MLVVVLLERPVTEKYARMEEGAMYAWSRRSDPRSAGYLVRDPHESAVSRTLDCVFPFGRPSSACIFFGSLLLFFSSSLTHCRVLIAASARRDVVKSRRRLRIVLPDRRIGVRRQFDRPAVETRPRLLNVSRPDGGGLEDSLIL